MSSMVVVCVEFLEFHEQHLTFQSPVFKACPPGFLYQLALASVIMEVAEGETVVRNSEISKLTVMLWWLVQFDEEDSERVYSCSSELVSSIKNGGSGTYVMMPEDNPRTTKG